MSGTGRTFVQDLLRLSSTDYLRDYTHAAKTFRTNSYQNAPKLKFLFHTYFTINPGIYFPGSQTNYALLVKEASLPKFNPQTTQLNQYNRKRIVQTKIKYDPIDITFHDDNGNQTTKLWESYYNYYYYDGTAPGAVLPAAGARGGTPGTGPGGASYNMRDIYSPTPDGTFDWGYSGGVGTGTTDSTNSTKTPFFNQITIFGFNQHQYTAYTLINPMITNFSHDTYAYSEGAGTMSNKMTIDYETVVYNYGGMDGREPGNIVTMFGDPANYDTTLSPIALEGSNGTVLGQGSLVNAAGGFVNALQHGNLPGAIHAATAAYDQLAGARDNAQVIYNAFQNPNLNTNSALALNTMRALAGQNAPTNRNTLFNIPIARSTPGPAGLAASPVIKALTNAILPNIKNAGSQYTG